MQYALINTTLHLLRSCEKSMWGISNGPHSTWLVACRLVQQLGLGPLLAAWADTQLSQPGAMEDVEPQCAKLLAALMTGACPARSGPPVHISTL